MAWQRSGQLGYRSWQRTLVEQIDRRIGRRILIGQLLDYWEGEALMRLTR